MGDYCKLTEKIKDNINSYDKYMRNAFKEYNDYEIIEEIGENYISITGDCGTAIPKGFCLYKKANKNTSYEEQLKQIEIKNDIEFFVDPNVIMCQRDEGIDVISNKMLENHVKCNHELRRILKDPREKHIETNNILDKTERHARFGGWYCDISIFDNII